MRSESISEVIDQHLDIGLLVDAIQRFARIPTEVPPGHETMMAPDDPKLVHYVQGVVRPELERMAGVGLLDAPLNSLVAIAGSGESGRSLLLMNYTPTQHNNLMDDPFSGRIGNAAAYGRDEPAVFGQGVSQNKVHQATMVAVLDLLQSSGVELSGRLYWAVNNEGRSSHSCSDAILDALPDRSEFGIIQIGTGLQLSLGNRGRIDVIVHVQGRASHSSEPERGHSVIDGASEVVQRLKALDWTDEEHPLLGGRHAVVYKVRYAPLAPHTLPSDAWLTIDRRLLPGDDPSDAVREIEETIGDLSPFQYTVEPDVMMLPALVDPDLDWVAALARAHEQVVGGGPERIWGRGSFDAGGPCARGVPTVMYGAGGGAGLLGDDFVVISDAVAEARVLSRLILEELV